MIRHIDTLHASSTHSFTSGNVNSVKLICTELDNRAGSKHCVFALERYNFKTTKDTTLIN